ncbi:GTPase/DUF3482 domain-containing protein [Pseudidiomarina homiensis]|uniref:GTPase/DUF3482 domain-containing protein n=1 Tax=Pseudidiomarina homiensis TaxID=364198 RepID=UPI00215AB9A8|nr:GTPase/DUF3482 domain-containing protein [Pseudidiomarina homiensis]
MSSLKIAVVGHTNAGKTSLLRTLLHSRQFGEVDQRPSTTRSVLEQGVWLEGQQLLAFYDTPGLESGSELFNEVEAFVEQFRHDGPAQIRAFLASALADDRFAQEAKVLRQLLQSDAAFYVIDCRDPVLPKYQDELHLLTRCGKPLIPVLNYTAAAGQQEQAWRQALAKLSLHAVVAFDTVTPPEGGEAYLLESLATVVPSAAGALKELIAWRGKEREQRLHGALHAVAELLVDVASYQEVVPQSAPEHELQTAIERLQRRIRMREQDTVRSILNRFAFLPEDAIAEQLDSASGAWQEDLFAPEVLKAWGKDAGFGIGAGAATGAGIDLMVGGMSLGAATALGAAAGGLYQSWRHLGEKLKQRWRGQRELHVDNATLAALTGRQLYLLQQLVRRGHAATETLTIAKSHRVSREQFKTIEQSLGPILAHTPDIDRQRVVTELAGKLEENWSA